jgi:hypothetical protein
MAAPYPKHLLEQARHLATREQRRPRQVNLRRAVSSAYYGLFHLLAQDATRSFAPKSDPRLRLLLPRVFVHEEMASACRTFATRGQLPAVLQQIYPSLVIPVRLAAIAQAFIDLQKARHDADYATHREWTRTMALTEVERAEQAFRDWEAIRPRGPRAAAHAGLNAQDCEAGRLFLAWLVFQKKLQGRS